MPENARLTELRRQRALIQDHLAWLDRQIEAEQTENVVSADAPSPTSAGTSSFRTAPTGVVERNSATAAVQDADVESFLEGYRIPSGDLTRSVRKGCLLYFLAALAVLAAGVVGLYFALRG